MLPAGGQKNNRHYCNVEQCTDSLQVFAQLSVGGIS